MVTYEILHSVEQTCKKNRECKYYVGFEILTAVVIKCNMFWDITPCSAMSVNRRFGRTYRLHLQGGFHAGFLLSLFFRP
jgi:hypothetical protein